MRRGLIVFGVFGKWVADNATEIAILDVIQEEE